MKKIILPILLFWGCGHGPTSVQLNSQQSTPYKFVMENTHLYDPPYVAFFQRQEKHLYFVVSAPAAVIERASILEHPTLRTIHQSFEEIRPQLVIIHDIFTGDTLDPKSVVPLARRCRRLAYEKGCSEALFAINEAGSFDTHYLSGEADFLDIKKAILDAGHSERDLLGHFVLRQIPRLKHWGLWSELQKKKLVKEQLKAFSRNFEIEQKIGLHEFDQWYRLHRVGLKNWNEVTLDDMAPHSEVDASFQQKIGQIVAAVRVKALQGRIQWGLENFDKVMVVHPSSDYLSLRDAFEKTMGRPREVKRF